MTSRRSSVVIPKISPLLYWGPKDEQTLPLNSLSVVQRPSLFHALIVSTSASGYSALMEQGLKIQACMVEDVSGGGHPASKRPTWNVQSGSRKHIDRLREGVRAAIQGFVDEGNEIKPTHLRGSNR